MGEPIRVLIADDHAIVREGLRKLLSRSGFELVGEAANGVEALALAVQLRPDVIVLDLKMPLKDGLAVIRELKDVYADARILVLTSFDDDDKVFPAIKMGAQGYLLKDSPPDQLLQAIQEIHQGKSSLHPDIARKVLHEIRHPPALPPAEQPLTEREIEVLQLIAVGLSNQKVADRLVISERTVAGHVRNILGKLHLASRTQAALYAIRTGLSDPRVAALGE
jgi:NarL family two-component system response regulator LiaR